MPDLQLQLSNTLIVRGYGVHFCVTNPNPSTATNIYLDFFNEFLATIYSVLFEGSIPPYSVRCFSHDLAEVRGIGHILLRVMAKVGDTVTWTGFHPAFIDPGIAPGIPWDEKKPLYMMGLAGGLMYGGFYKGSYIPRPRYVDYLILDDILTGSTAVLTKDEIEKGVQPVFKKNVIYQLRAEYAFKSKEALANIILSQVPLLAEWFDLTQLSYDQIIDLGIPFLADKMLRERGVVAIRRTGETRLEFVTHIASAGAPWAFIILGIGVLVSIGLGLYNLYRQEKHEAEDAAEHRNLWSAVFLTRKEAWELFLLTADNLSPTALQISKEELLKRALEIRKRGDEELNKLMLASGTVTGEEKKPAEISFWDKLKYGLIGAGAAVLLARGTPVVTPYIIERARREE